MLAAHATVAKVNSVRRFIEVSVFIVSGKGVRRQPLILHDRIVSYDAIPRFAERQP